MKKENILAGLDIGSTKVSVIVGRPNGESLEIIGLGTAANQGFKKGVVVNIENTTEAIRQAREEAELMAGVQVDEVWLGVGGSHIQSFDSQGMVAVREREIAVRDIERVVQAAKAVSVPGDREVIHVLPREFKIDEQDGILDPIGMSGVRLEAAVHIVTAGKTALQNMTKCTEKAGLAISGLVLEPFSSALACLTEDEKQLGAVLVDIGGGSSDIVIIHKGSIAFTSSVPLGGSHITNDIAVGLRTPLGSAETLKRKFGCALGSLIDGQESIEVEGVGNRRERTVLRQHLCEIIEPRADEILNYIQNEILKSGYASQLGGGVVLTGGGSLLDGMSELGEFIFDMPVRKAQPQGFGGLVDVARSAQFSTSVGLLFYAMKFGKEAKKYSGNPVGQWMSRVKNLVDSVF